MQSSFRKIGLRQSLRHCYWLETVCASIHCGAACVGIGCSERQLCRLYGDIAGHRPCDAENALRVMVPAVLVVFSTLLLLPK